MCASINNFSFNPHNNPMRYYYYYYHFMGKKMRFVSLHFLRAAITNYYRLGSLNQQEFLSQLKSISIHHVLLRNWFYGQERK